jgi:hypothetical protein
MDKLTGLERAREVARAKREAGEVIVHLDPLTKHRLNPGSLRLAINAKCYDCVGCDLDPGVRRRIRTCACTHCPLHSVRPYQRGEEEEQ